MPNPILPPRMRKTAALLSVLLTTLAAAASYASPDSAADNDPAEPISPIPPPIDAKDGKAELGKLLFGSRILSRDNQRSCSSCHDVSTNGAEPRRIGVSPLGQPLRYNTPTVFNAALNFRQHWEGEAASQKDQVMLSIGSPDFMNESWDDLILKLNKDSALNGRFIETFGRAADKNAVVDAVAAYEATLLTPDSRFDLWLRGDKTALNEEELEGYRLFKSAGCVACHQGVNVGGNLFAKAGVFQPLLKKPAKRMRVPSLRNVAVTAPYFDDGSAATLDEAVRRMAEAQLGRKLTPPQIDKIVAFLKSLTGRFEGRLLKAPPSVAAPVKAAR